MHCEICGRELSPGEGFVRLEAYVVVSKDVFRPSGCAQRKRVCLECLISKEGMLKALQGGSVPPERSEG